VVVQLVNALPGSPAPDSSVPIVASCSQQNVKVSASAITPPDCVEVGV